MCNQFNSMLKHIQTIKESGAAHMGYQTVDQATKPTETLRTAVGGLLRTALALLHRHMDLQNCGVVSIKLSRKIFPEISFKSK